MLAAAPEQHKEQGPLAGTYAGRVPLQLWHILGFFVFSHLWTFLFWQIAVWTSRSVWEFPGTLFLIIGGSGVLLGALVMTWLTYGWEGMRDLAKRAIGVRRVPLRWWLVVLFLPLAMKLIPAAVAAAFGTPIPLLFNLEPGRIILANPAALLQILVLFFIYGPLPEEMGWRGYLLDRLQVKWTALKAGLAMGLAIWVWHLPLYILPGYFDAVNSAPMTPLNDLFYTLAAGLLSVWLYNNTNRSILALMVFHYLGSISGIMLSPGADVQAIEPMFEVFLGLAVLWWWGARSLTEPQSSR